MSGEQSKIGPEKYNLGIADYALGFALRGLHLITRQMGHNPAGAQHEAPMVPTEIPKQRMATIPGNFDSEGTEVLEQVLASHEIES